MRERLDEINPRQLRPAFTSIFSTLQRGKQLERFVYLDGNGNTRRLKCVIAFNRTKGLRLAKILNFLLSRQTTLHTGDSRR